MSLINEALKKAQRQRIDPAQTTITTAPTLADAGAPVPRIAKRRPPMPARTLMLLLVGGGLMLVMGGVLAFVWLRLDSKPPVIAKVAPVHHDTPAPAVQPVIVPAIATAPSVATVATPVHIEAVLPPLPPAPAPSPVPVVQTPIAVTTPPAPAPASIVHPHPPTNPSKPVSNPAVYIFLDALRVTGVRMSGEDSKVIMNDRIVRLNDYVDRTLGLRLTNVTPSSLVFTDDAGFEYTKAL